MPILWSTTPPPRPLRSDIGLIAVDAGETVLARLLGPAWWVSCHWVEPHSILCKGAEECKVHSYPVTVKGFIAVQSANRNWRGVTKGLFLSVLCLTPEIGEDVVACKIGDCVSVSRAPGTSKNPLSLLRSKKQSTEPLPEGFDVRPFVERACAFRKRKVAVIGRVG